MPHRQCREHVHAWQATRTGGGITAGEYQYRDSKRTRAYTSGFERFEQLPHESSVLARVRQEDAGLGVGIAAGRRELEHVRAGSTSDSRRGRTRAARARPTAPEPHYFLFNRIGIMASGSLLLKDPSSLATSTSSSSSNLTVTPFAVCL